MTNQITKEVTSGSEKHTISDKNYDRVTKHFLENIVNININESLTNEIIIFLAQMKHFMIERKDLWLESNLTIENNNNDEFSNGSVDLMIEKLIMKIENDDKNSNYTKHLFTRKKLIELMQRDLRENKIKSKNTETRLFDKLTGTLVDNYCYDALKNVNFYKTITSYNHWQLKNMIKIDPINGNICFVNKDRIFELDTNKKDITISAHTNQLLKNFDVNQNYIVSCGIEQDRAFERNNSVFKNNIYDVMILEDYSDYIPGTHVYETNNGIISITNRENSRTEEVKVGKLLNNDVVIMPHNNSGNDLELMTVNNDGFIYKLALKKNKPTAKKINLINKSLNTIDLSLDGKIAGISTDESYTLLLETHNLEKQFKIIHPRLGKDIYASTPTLDELKYNMSKVDQITSTSSGRYGFGTKFSPVNNFEFATIFQNGLIQFYDIRNMKKPVRDFVGLGNTMSSQLRGLCYDSKGRLYVSQECGIVHCIDPRSSVDSHKVINIPSVMPLKERADIDNFYLKEATPFISKTDDTVNLYRWFEERIGIITSNKYFSSLCKNITLDLHKGFDSLYFNRVNAKKILHFNKLVSLDRLNYGVAVENKLLTEHEEAHLESTTWNLPKNKTIENMRQVKRHMLETVDKVETFYPDVFERFNDQENYCYADLVPFNKIVASDFQGLKMTEAQDSYIDVIKRDQRLSHFYNNSEKRMSIHEPMVFFDNGQRLTISEATTLGTELIQNKKSDIDFLEMRYHDDIRMPCYKSDEMADSQLDKTYSDFIIDEYKKTDTRMNMEYIPDLTTDNGITGLNIRKNGRDEELVIGVGTGIYTISI
ncbi:hypothetical protein QEN19_001851 [Hanseniaspora menglaensis]